MYESFFKLSKKPFELLPDPDFMYLSGSHKKALTYLDYGIRERAGFILLTGEVGSGKTTLIRNLLKKKYERVVLAKVFNTRVNSEQLLSMINDDFGLPVRGKDKVALLHELNEFLVQQFAAGNQPILIIDEAQNLDADLLEEVRLLSNLESPQSKLLQIVLVGQPELRQTLATPGLMQLRQRISINCHLTALKREEVPQYIEHRMTVAGNALALEFTEETLDLLYCYSKGIPRLINIFCDFILLSAFADESRTVTAAMVQEVIGELDLENHFWGTSAAVTSPPPVSAAQPAVEAHPLLKEMTDRLDAVERNLSQMVPSALQTVCDSIAALKGELSAQQSRHDAQVTDLSRKMVDLSPGRHSYSVITPSTCRTVPPGFARRLLNSFSGKK